MLCPAASGAAAAAHAPSEEPNEGSDAEAVLVRTSPYVPPTPEQRRCAQRELARLAAQTEDRRRRLAELRQRQAAELGEGHDRKGMRVRHLMEQVDMLSTLALLPEAGASGSKPGGKPSAAKPQERRRAGRMSEKEEDERLLLQSGGAAGGEGLSSSGSTRLTVQPACITGQMRSYQLEGLNWLIRAYESGVNGVLADEMGLGKTLQTIALLGFLKEQLGLTGPHLVVVPKSTLGNWFNEIKRWCPMLSAIKFHGDKAARKRLVDTVIASGTFDVCITTYEVVISEKSALMKHNWLYVIIDEAHRIKNETSILSQTVRLFDVYHRLLITGTPLQNNLRELWAMLNFLLPDAFDDAMAFDQFGEDAGSEDSAAQSVVGNLHKLLTPVLLRRLKTEVEKELPPKKELKLFVRLSAMQRQWYQNILSKNIDALNDMGANKVRMLNILMQLRKCCNHPYLFDGAEQPPFINDDRLIDNGGKFRLLDKLLPRLKADGHRVLIFSQMTRMLDILEDYLWYRSHRYCRIDGSTGSEARDERIESFNAPGSDVFVFLLSTRAGGLGINLTTADTVILYDSDWNPQMDLQAMDRAHRIGQTKPVMVYRFVTEGSVEEKIIERAQKKLYLDALERGLGKDELLGMIRFGADAIFKSAESGATEEDLDAILRRGDETAAVESERLKSSEQNLLNFSIGATQEKSIYDYGEAAESTTAVPSLPYINLPQRERKKNYNDEEAYKAMMREVEGGKPRAGRPVGARRADFDFQFWGDKSSGSEEAQRAEAPEDMFGHWTRKEYNAFIRGCELYGRDDVASITTEINASIRGDSSVESADANAEANEAADGCEEHAEPGVADASSGGINGTPCGRSASVGSGSGKQLPPPKTESDVAAYLAVFFKRFKEVKDGDKIVRRIEANERRRKALDSTSLSLRKKIEMYDDPAEQLVIKYSLSRHERKYTESCDRFLLVKTAELGHGKWDQLKLELMRSEKFCFDHYAKSRTPQELGRRVEALLKLIEREMEQLKKQESQGRTADVSGSSKKRSKGGTKASILSPEVDGSPDFNGGQEACETPDRDRRLGTSAARKRPTSSGSSGWHSDVHLSSASKKVKADYTAPENAASIDDINPQDN
ncbi:hypothetical protein AB1Y20_021675 [Prymnesium parvum]|uniref:Uncharacterized protein n=1 Tax=Prymnesium parvum TaxID=97485 RepID=A0AB34JIX8_PRYPA